MVLASRCRPSTASSGGVTAPPRLSLRWGFLATLLGRFAYAGCQWGILAVLAKLGSPESVGAFGWAMALTAPLFMFSTMQLRFVVATDAREEFDWRDFVALRLAPRAWLGSIFVGLLAAGYWPTHTWLILAVATAKAIECFSDLVLGLLQQRERMDRVGWLQLLKGIGSLVVVALMFHGTRQVVLAAWGMAVVWLIVLFVAEMPATRWSMGGRLSWRPRWQWDRLLHLLWFALPAGCCRHLLISFNSNLPRYFIQATAGERDLGIFVAIASLVLLGETVYRAASQAVTARLAILASTGRSLRLSANCPATFGPVNFVGTARHRGVTDDRQTAAELAVHSRVCRACADTGVGQCGHVVFLPVQSGTGVGVAAKKPRLSHRVDRGRPGPGVGLGLARAAARN